MIKNNDLNLPSRKGLIVIDVIFSLLLCVTTLTLNYSRRKEKLEVIKYNTQLAHHPFCEQYNGSSRTSSDEETRAS